MKCRSFYTWLTEILNNNSYWIYTDCILHTSVLYHWQMGRKSKWNQNLGFSWKFFSIQSVIQKTLNGYWPYLVQQRWQVLSAIFRAYFKYFLIILKWNFRSNAKLITEVIITVLDICSANSSGKNKSRIGNCQTS